MWHLNYLLGLMLLTGCVRGAQPQPSAVKTLEAGPAGDLAPGMAQLPLASLTANPGDQSVLLYQAPLPAACRTDEQTATLCTAPVPLTMPLARYQTLAQSWGHRKSERGTQLDALLQVSAHEWTLLIKPGDEPPLLWWDPNSDGFLNLWPVLPVVRQVVGHQSKSLPTTFPQGHDTLRLGFAPFVPPLAKWQLDWLNSYTLRIRWTPPPLAIHILIDPGHGGSETGTQHFGLAEKDLNLKAALVLKASFEARHAVVSLSRDHDVTLPVSERFHLVEQGSFDLGLSIHHDWASPALFPIRPACFFSRYDAFSLANELCQILEAASGAPVGTSRRDLMVTQPRRTPVLLLELVNFQDARGQALLTNAAAYDHFLQIWADQTAAASLQSLAKAHE